jgi:hypothetical protein
MPLLRLYPPRYKHAKSSKFLSKTRKRTHTSLFLPQIQSHRESNQWAAEYPVTELSIVELSAEAELSVPIELSLAAGQ